MRGRGRGRTKVSYTFIKRALPLLLMMNTPCGGRELRRECESAEEGGRSVHSSGGALVQTHLNHFVMGGYLYNPVEGGKGGGGGGQSGRKIIVFFLSAKLR